MITNYEAEIARMEKLVKNELSPNAVELAVVEGLKSAAVRDLLYPNLERGLAFKRVQVQPIGTFGNVVHFEILTEWQEGKGGTESVDT